MTERLRWQSPQAAERRPIRRRVHHDRRADHHDPAWASRAKAITGRWIGSAQMLITGHDSKIRQLTDVSHCNLQHHF
jgi:hypothetical protein